MAALTADRGIIEHKGDNSAPVYQSTIIYGGSIVCMNSSGYAVPGATSTSLVALGCALKQVDNSSGSSGDLNVPYRVGVFSFKNSSGADEITEVERGQVCYIVDDQTVAKTDGTGTRSVAGKIQGLDEYGNVKVWFNWTITADGDLVAANNLSDVASAATARANIGANKVMYQFRCPLDAAGVFYFQSPVAGDIESIRSAMTGALTGGDPTITGAIDGTPITGGVLTLAASGSGAGVKDSASPSAAKTVAAGNNIEFTVAPNSQSNAEFADVSVYIET